MTRSWAEEIVKSHPKSPGAWLTLGQILISEGELQKAQDCFEYVLLLDPLMNQAKIEIQNLEELDAKKSQHDRRIANKGRGRGRQRKRRYLKLPTWLFVIIISLLASMLGVYLSRYINRDVARGTGITPAPSPISEFNLPEEAGSYFYYEVASQLADSGQYEQAMLAFDKAIETAEDQHKSGLYNSRGFVRLRFEEYQLAIDDFNQAIKMSTSSTNLAYCYNNRGYAYGMIGEYDRAFDDFEESFIIQPDNAWLLYHRGLIRLKMGDKEKAQEDLELSLELNNPSLDSEQLDEVQDILNNLQ